MRAGRGILGGASAVILLLAACSSDSGLMNISPGDTDGPDEFGVLPTAPLERPAEGGELPRPDPGGPNRADPDPRGDAAVALGGARGSAGGVPSSDGALVQHAARQGSEEDIRARLAAEDEQYRQRNRGRLLERITNRNTYYQAYAPMTLDSRAELERWRAAEARTPGAPPAQD